MQALARATFALIALAATIGFASGQAEYDGSIDFSAYRSYAWREGTRARRPEAQKLIVEAVERDLLRKGLTLVEQDPDFYVATHALVERHTPKELADPTYWDFVTGITNIDAFAVKGGTLVVDVIDASTNDRVWRGVASESVKGKPGKEFKKIDSVVRSILKRFPPK